MEIVSPETQFGFVFFMILTTLYFVLSYLLCKPSRGVKSQSFGLMLSVCYYLMVLCGQYLINLSTTASLCNGVYQYMNAAYITLIPWVLIFGILNLMLLIFPGWLSPFSNTFGYGMTTMLGIKKVIRNVFKDPGTVSGQSDKATEALNYIYGNQSLLVNEITMENFDQFVGSMKTLLKAGTDTKDVKILKDLIYLKELVAQYVWFVLTGSLVISVATNSIINAGCNYNEDAIKGLSKLGKVSTAINADATL
tara:strand:- start:7576 stop:8328 length:753 start_codon:yes stop_codon:yes gene_type:complete